MRDILGGIALGIAMVSLAACGSSAGGGNGGGDDGTTADAPGGGSGSGSNNQQCDPDFAQACDGADIVACNADGTFGPVASSCGDGQMCTQAGDTVSCTRACTADGVDLVYVVDVANNFMSFDPRILAANPSGTPSAFTQIGKLTCPTTLKSIQSGTVGKTPTPYSMSIDRDGKAWVLYSSGEVFNVSLTDASCTATAWVPQDGGMKLFGMGYVTDSAGADTEKLFLAGGGVKAAPGGKLADVDTHAGMLTPQAAGSAVPSDADASPELTGTNQAKLFGFFPVLATPSFIEEIDRTSGAAVAGTRLDVGPDGLGNEVEAWAFAQWGGKFYVFVTSDNDNTVRVVDRTTGMYTLALDKTPNEIVGAGVSTCAPSVVVISKR